MESDSYAENAPINSENLPVVHNSDEVSDAAKLAREKLHNTNEAMAKKKSIGAKENDHGAAFYQSKEFLDMMVLLNNNCELLLKILGDLNSFISFLESQQSSCAEKVLDR